MSEPSVETERPDPPSEDTVATIVRNVIKFVVSDDVETIEKLRLMIEGALEVYRTQLLFDRFRQPVTEQKAHLRKLRGALVKTVDAFRQLTPEYVVAIGAKADQVAPSASLDIVNLPDDLVRLVFGIDDFLDAFEPPTGRQPNWQLERTVRYLLPEAERLAGGPARVSLNKLNERQPEPRSAAAKLIVGIIYEFKNAPSQTAIVNMIEKVKNQPEEERDILSAIIEAQDDPHEYIIARRPNQTEHEVTDIDKELDEWRKKHANQKGNRK